MLDKIKAEIRKVLDRERDFTTESAKAQALALMWVLELIDKYAEQEPCENCCNGDQIEKARLCQKSYLAGMEHKQEPCDDAISRQAVLEIIDDEWLCNAEYEFRPLVEAIEKLPSVRPQEQTGHWISHYDEDAKEGWYECNHCHTERAFNTKFCPDCGAKMVEPQESEDEE